MGASGVGRPWRADGKATTVGTTRCVFPARPARTRWDCSWFEPARTTGRPNLFESHQALTETGAVRVRWNREQLIGGKPERLVSRALRVPIWVLDQMEYPI